MVQPEEKIRRYLRKVELMIQGDEARGKPRPADFCSERTALMWVLGRHSDPPGISEEELARLDKMVRAISTP